MTPENQKLLDSIKGKLIVSCQARPGEPLRDSKIMGAMALSAKWGGASAIRANTVPDVLAIKESTGLPILGIIKRDYDDSEVYTTPTMKEVDELVEAGCDIIAVDATDRLRPEGVTFTEFFTAVRAKYPDQLFMADAATYEEGKLAFELGCDLIGTTMRSYTKATEGCIIPDFDLISKLANELGATVIAEGGIWEPWQLKKALDSGAHAAVVGTAITRPHEITKRFVNAITE